MGSNRLMTASALKWITILSLLALSWLPAGATESPLTNVDIVRMTALQLPETEILRTIRDADQVEFDLSDDVVSEMRLVGVTAGVIKAMEARLTQSAHPGLISRPTEGVIEVVFMREETPGAEKRPGLPLPRAALFLICLDPTHVPDHWTAKTRLAENFPRHHLLWFHEPPLLAEDAEKKKRGRSKHLTLPAPARVSVEAGEHPIEVGIAVWAPEQTWIPLAVASRTLNVVAGATVRLVLSVATHKPPAKEAVTVEIVEPAAVMAVPSGEKSPAP